MAIRNQNWYDLNSARDYPLDGDASCVDDRGGRLPSHYVADLYLKYPNTVARIAYLGGITVGPKIVTAVIMGAMSLDDPRPVPLAAVSLATPVDLFRQYPLDALYPGVGGWIAFGPGANGDVLSARFTTAAQSFFAPRAAKSYDPLPIPDVGKLGVTSPLTGIVALQAGNDIEIVKEERLGQQCIVIRLKNTSSNTALARNVFQIYQSPCLTAPESETCGDPQPIQFLGPVQPDCCGNITIKFRGCAAVSAITASATVNPDNSVTIVPVDNGVVIDCGLGLSQACITAPYLPDETGKLPNEYPDLCSSLSVSAVVSYSENLGWTPSWSFSFEALYGEELRSHSDEFSFSWTDSWSYDFKVTDNDVYSDEFSSISAWTLVAGYFAKAPIFQNLLEGGQAFSTHFSDSAAGINVAVCQNIATRSFFFRRVCTVVRVDQGDQGSAHNAAVLAAVRPVDGDLAQFACFAAEIDWDAFREGVKLFRIARFDGHNWFTLASVPVPQLALGHMYRLTLAIFPHGPEDGWLQASLSGVDNPVPVALTLGPIAVTGVGPDDGTTYSGLHTKQSRADFLWFGVETA